MVSTEDRRTAHSGVRGDGDQGESGSANDQLFEIVGQLARLARIRIARTRLHTRRKAFLVFGVGLLALVAGAISLAGVRLFVGGLSQGLRELVADDRLWLAELWTGLLLLAGTGIVLVTAWRIAERRVLREHLGGDDLQEPRGMGDKREDEGEAEE